MTDQWKSIHACQFKCRELALGLMNNNGADQSQIFRRLCTLAPQPLDQLSGAASTRRIDWRQRVVSDPVEVRAAVEQILRRTPLTAVASTPEGVSHLVMIGRHVSCEMLLDTGHQP